MTTSVCVSQAVGMLDQVLSSAEAIMPVVHESTRRGNERHAHRKEGVDATTKRSSRTHRRHRRHRSKGHRSSSQHRQHRRSNSRHRSRRGQEDTTESAAIDAETPLRGVAILDGAIVPPPLVEEQTGSTALAQVDGEHDPRAKLAHEFALRSPSVGKEVNRGGSRSPEPAREAAPRAPPVTASVLQRSGAQQGAV